MVASASLRGLFNVVVIMIDKIDHRPCALSMQTPCYVFSGKYGQRGDMLEINLVSKLLKLLHGPDVKNKVQL